MSSAGCAVLPLTEGVGGALHEKARFASCLLIQPTHPEYSLLGFRVIDPPAPSPGGEISIWVQATALGYAKCRVYNEILEDLHS